MREIRTSGSMRGGRKRAFAWRACLLLYRAPSFNKALFPNWTQSGEHARRPLLVATLTILLIPC